MANNIRKYLLLLSIPVILYGCSQWDFSRIEFMKVITVGAIEVGSNVAFLLGDVEVLRNSEIVETGFVLSSTATDDNALRLDHPDVLISISNDQDTIRAETAFAVRISGLQASTSYAFRAYVKIVGDDQIAYGNIEQFRTTDLSISLFGIKRLSEACETNAMVEVRLDGFAKGGDTEVGIIWSHDLYQGTPSDLQGMTITERSPGGLLGSFIFDLPVECDKNYTLTAFASSPSSDTIFTDLISFTTLLGGRWIAKANFPGEMRDLPVSFATDNGLYLGGGNRPFQGTTESTHYFDFWTYSSRDDLWSEINRLEEAISSPVASSVDGTGYFGAGQWSSEKCIDFWGGDCLGSSDCSFGCHCMSKDFFKLEPNTGSGTKIQLPDSLSNIISRHRATSFTIENKIYIGLGNSTRSCGNVLNYVSGVDNRFEPIRIRRSNFFTHNDMWQFDPSTNEWIEMKPFPREGRINAIGYSIEDKGYVGLGHYYRDVNEVLMSGPLFDFYEFDPNETNGSQWTQLQPFPEEFARAKSFVLSNVGFVLIKKRLSLTTTIELWKFDRTEGTQGNWTQITESITPGTGLPVASLTIGSLAYVYIVGPTQNFWMYVPELL